MKLAHLLALILTPLPALAADWYLLGNTDIAAITEVSVDQTAETTPSSASDDAVILDVTACENIDVGVSEDSNGDGTGGSALTSTLQWCPVNQGDSTVNTDALRDVACVDYSGTLTGSGTIQGAGVPSGLIRIDFGGSFAGDPVVWLKCNGAKQ